MTGVIEEVFPLLFFVYEAVWWAKHGWKQNSFCFTILIDIWGVCLNIYGMSGVIIVLVCLQSALKAVLANHKIMYK